ncbi:FGGY-family carbohydrate kinase [Atopobium fossor]|uniref:FGGY-family carbohydrate kinase n=1 Tax=Atopobium fossor TaxID=39487 RepID=UPI0003F7934B|nr:FGGY family carbohydrate kinase [Atopobium fossor]
MSYAIGIDIGTTNSKVVLCSLPNCEPVYIGKFASPKLVAGTNVDYDIPQLLNLLFIQLANCAKYALQNQETIAFISVASIGESGVLIDGNNTYSDTSICWFDKRGSEFVNELIQSNKEQWLYRITGIPVHANSALFKILWLRKYGISLTNKTWLPMADFIAWVLCDTVGQDVTLASRTAVLDINTLKISSEILDYFELPHTLFPPLVKSGTFRGFIKSSVAQTTGISEKCQVAVTGHDHMSGSVACQLQTNKELLNSTGTSEGILAVVNNPKIGMHQYECQITNGMYVQDNTYSLYASLPTAGFSFEWALEVLNISLETFNQNILSQLFDTYIDKNFILPNEIFIPHLRGSGPPQRSREARGVFYGLTENTQSINMLFAVHLGVACELYGLYSHMALSNYEVIKVIGPALQNPLWMQLKADLLDKKIVGCSLSEAVACGSIMTTAQRNGIEVYNNLQTVEYIPNKERSKKLKMFYMTTYKPLAEAIHSFENSLFGAQA